jgi:hypothetical protein
MCGFTGVKGDGTGVEEIRILAQRATAPGKGFFFYVITTHVLLIVIYAVHLLLVLFIFFSSAS